MKIISLNCGEMIKREEDLSSCRFAEVTLRLRGRIPYEPEFFFLQLQKLRSVHDQIK